jgi:2-aminoadipate transaminase
MREATARVLRDSPREAMQYAASEGYGPLREWVAQYLAAHQGMTVAPSHVLITNGSQQGLDLAAKVLIDEGARVLVETPTYLGAIQAFTPYEPRLEGVESDGSGPLPESIAAIGPGARFAYLLPNFQNPSGHVYSEARREAVVEVARRAGLALLEDNPYGDLWYDVPPPRSLASRWPEGVIYRARTRARCDGAAAEGGGGRRGLRARRALLRAGPARRYAAAVVCHRAATTD